MPAHALLRRTVTKATAPLHQDLLPLLRRQEVEHVCDTDRTDGANASRADTWDVEGNGIPRAIL